MDKSDTKSFVLLIFCLKTLFMIFIIASIWASNQVRGAAKYAKPALVRSSKTRPVSPTSCHIRVLNLLFSKITTVLVIFERKSLLNGRYVTEYGEYDDSTGLIAVSYNGESLKCRNDFGHFWFVGADSMQAHSCIVGVKMTVILILILILMILMILMVLILIILIIIPILIILILILMVHAGSIIVGVKMTGNQFVPAGETTFQVGLW